MSNRYQVKSIGGMWRVNDRASGKTLAFRQCYQCALMYASNLERQAAAPSVMAAA